VQRAAKTPLTGDKIDAPAACAVPFRPYYGGVVTRTQNVSEYMLVLALCLVNIGSHSTVAASVKATAEIVNVGLNIDPK